MTLQSQVNVTARILANRRISIPDAQAAPPDARVSNGWNDRWTWLSPVLAVEYREPLVFPERQQTLDPVLGSWVCPEQRRIGEAAAG
jgi:hypothetical protein